MTKIVIKSYHLTMSREIFANFNDTSRSFHSKEGVTNYFDSSTGPYEYLLGALSGCYYSTLVDVLKGRVTYDSCDIHVEGEKRSETPTTLEHTKMTISVKNPYSFELFKEACIETSNYCSIYQTIAKVSKMELVICQVE